MAKYHMHRKEREITDLNVLTELIKGGRYAVVSMCRDNEPYVVALSYGYDSAANALYFHCAHQGLKLDFINSNPSVCVMIIKDYGYRTDECAHEYATVVIRGKMSIIEEPVEKKNGMDFIFKQLVDSPELIKEKHMKNDVIYDKITVLKLTVAEMSGKRGK